MIKPNITFVHMDSTEAIINHCHKKVRVLDKHIQKTDDSVTCSVELSKTTNHHHKGAIYKTEINLHTRGKNHHVENTQTDLYASIDKGVAMLVHELTTHYGKKQAVWKRGAGRIKQLLRN